MAIKDRGKELGSIKVEILFGAPWAFVILSAVKLTM